MTIEVDNALLSRALTAIGKVTQNAASSPVHKCVHVTAKNSKLRLRGSDLTAYVEKVIPYVGDTEGTWLVVYESFFHYIKSSSGKTILSFTDSHLKMKSGNDKATAPLRDPAEYLTWPDWKSLAQIDCDGNALVNAIKMSIGCVSSSMMSVAMYSVSIRSVKGGLGIDVQATDSFRYFYSGVPSKEKPGKICVLVPHNTASRLLDAELPIVAVALSSSLLGLRSKTGAMYVTLANDPETFPVLRERPQAPVSLEITVSRDELAKIFEKASGFTDAEQSRKTLIKASKDALSISVASSGLGSYEGVVKPKSGKGSAIEIYVDSQHVTYFLAITKSEDITMCFSNDEAQHKPLRFKDPTNPEMYYLTWPLIVTGS